MPEIKHDALPEPHRLHNLPYATVTPKPTIITEETQKTFDQHNAQPTVNEAAERPSEPEKREIKEPMESIKQEQTTEAPKIVTTPHVTPASVKVETTIHTTTLAPATTTMAQIQASTAAPTVVPTTVMPITMGTTLAPSVTPAPVTVAATTVATATTTPATVTTTPTPTTTTMEVPKVAATTTTMTIETPTITPAPEVTKSAETVTTTTTPVTTPLPTLREDPKKEVVDEKKTDDKDTHAHEHHEYRGSSHAEKKGVSTFLHRIPSLYKIFGMQTTRTGLVTS